MGKLIAGLAMTGAVMSSAVVLASPAQAAPVTKCSAWVQGPPSLWAAACTKRDGDNIYGWVAVLNSASTQYYVSQIGARLHYENLFHVCTVNAWIPPGAPQKTCATPLDSTPTPVNTIGIVNYWTGSQYAPINVSSPSV